MAIFFYVEEMGLCQRLSKKWYFRIIVTWARIGGMDQPDRHPHVGPGFVPVVPHSVRIGFMDLAVGYTCSGKAPHIR